MEKNGEENSLNARSSDISFFKDLFLEQINSFHYSNYNLFVPPVEHTFVSRPNMAYHFKPELFIQLGGGTEFQFYSDKKYLKTGEICIMPRGIAHGEQACNDTTTFRNVVICFYNDTITMHVACANEVLEPKAIKVYFFKSDLFADCITILDRVALLKHTELNGSEKAIRGLMTGFFALMLNVLEAGSIESSPESHRVNQCQWLIRMHLNDPNLSVTKLADLLNCSPNYLSKLFHQHTGEKITTYVNRTRLGNAVHILESSALTVKEIAYSCGFRDPNYFSRIFKNRFEMSPHDYRLAALKPKSRESVPKVVFSDHEEYDFGRDIENHTISIDDSENG